MGLKKRIYKFLFDVPGAEGWRYKRSMDLFILEAIAGTSMGTLTGGAFLSGYALLLGASDYMAGLILSLPLLTNIFQMLSAIIYERMQSRKRLIWMLQFVYRAMSCAVIVIPIVFPEGWRVAALFIMAFLSYAALSALAPGSNAWFVSLIPERVRGRYMSKREAMFQSSAMIISLIMGRVLDVMGRGYAGFAVVYGTAAAFAAMELYLLSRIEEPPINADNLHSVKFKELFVVPLTNKPFMTFVVFWVLWIFSLWIGNSFFSVYMIKYLKLSYTYINILSTVSLLVYILCVRLWGYFGDTIGWDKGLKIACAILAVAFYLWVFIYKANAVLLFLVNILGGISWSGINISSFNTVFKLSPEKGKTIYLGFNAAFTGIAGFMGPVIGGWLLNHRFIPGLNGMQSVFLISAVAQTIALLYGMRRMKIE